MTWIQRCNYLRMEKKSEKIGNVILDLSYYSGEDMYSEGAAEDQILEIVKNEPQEKYNELIARMMTWKKRSCETSPASWGR